MARENKTRPTVQQFTGGVARQPFPYENSDYTLADPRNTYDLKEHEVGGGTRHIFVSSTFQDMQEERDALQRQLVPRIEREIESHGEKLDIVDLRWGVDTDSLNEADAARKVLSVCFDEIDRCRPHFICLVGDRYGWVPRERLWESLPDQRVAQRLAEARCTVPALAHGGLSVTAAEILYAAGNDQEVRQRGIACLRTAAPECQMGVPTIHSAHEKEITALRAWTAQAFGTTICYTRGEGGKQAACASLIDELSSKIMEQCAQDWARLEPVGIFDRLWTLNQRFVRTSTCNILGRAQFIQDACTKLWDSHEPLCLHGPSGCGKTACLAVICKQFEKRSDCMVIPFFPAADANYAHSAFLFDYLHRAIAAYFNELHTLPSKPPSAFSGQCALLTDLLNRHPGFTFVLALDDVDRVAGMTAEILVLLGRLKAPGTKASRVFLVYTARDESPYSTWGASHHIAVPLLDRLIVVKIAEHELRLNHREVTSSIHDTLSLIAQAGIPLQGKLIARTLALLGRESLSSLRSNKDIAQRIEEELLMLPSDVAEAAAGYCMRVRRATGNNCSDRIVQMLAAAPWGLTRTEIIEVLSEWGVPASTLDIVCAISLLNPIVHECIGGRIVLALDEHRRLVQHSAPLSLMQVDALWRIVHARAGDSVEVLANELHLIVAFEGWHLLSSFAVSHAPGRNTHGSACAALLLACADNGVWLAKALDELVSAGVLGKELCTFLVSFIMTLPQVRSADLIVAKIESALGSSAVWGHVKTERAQHAIEHACLRVETSRWTHIIADVDFGGRKHAILKRQGVGVSYIGETHRWQIAALDGRPAYDLDTVGYWNIQATEMRCRGYADLGLTFILAHGYPYHSIKDGGGQDYFITQAAVWWYVSDLGLCKLSESFRESSSDPYHLRPYIRKLVAGAHEARVCQNDVTLSMLAEVWISDEWASSPVVMLPKRPVKIIQGKHVSNIVRRTGNAGSPDCQS